MAERRKVGNYELLEKIGAGGMVLFSKRARSRWIVSSH